MITKPVLNNFRKDFADTVKQLEKKYNVTIELGSIKYSETNFHSKITVKELGENGTPTVNEKDFSIYARLLGVPETWLNLEFAGNKERLKIVGLNPRRSKNAVELVGVQSGKQYMGSIEFVKYQLAK